MHSTLRVLFSLALLASLATGCVTAVDGEEEAILEEAEGSAKGLDVRPLDPPRPGTESVSMEIVSVDDDGGLQETKQRICKVVPYGGVECDVWFCDIRYTGCVWSCGYSCHGSLDDCELAGCND